jgi:hypothetical protein
MQYFILFFAVIFSVNLYAQHCPYDGTHLVAIKVVDKKGQMLTNINTVFYLQEVDNPMADSCTSAAGLIKKQFLNSNAFTVELDKRFDRNGYNTALNKRLTNAGVFANANMMLTINQAENTCTLIGKSETVYTNYIYQQRNFVIAYAINGKEIRQQLPAVFIFSLCTNNKDLKNFKTLTVQL